MIRCATIAVLLACGRPAQSPVHTSSPRPAAKPGGDHRWYQVRATEDADPLIDATFDQESRGGRPTWTPPASVVGGIEVTLESLAPAVHACFARLMTPTIDVRLTVLPDGSATDVIVESRNAHARDCLSEAIRGAVFPISRHSWRVYYVFRP